MQRAGLDPRSPTRDTRRFFGLYSAALARTAQLAEAGSEPDAEPEESTQGDKATDDAEEYVCVDDVEPATTGS